MQVFWFKRDLRINDNEPLVEALKLGPVLPLYVFEPTLWLQPDLSYRHYLFLKDSINDLNKELSQLGQQLIIKVGPILKIFDDLHQRHKLTTIWGHHETWNLWTKNRNLQVENWAKINKIKLRFIQQNGIVKNLKNRNRWATAWYSTMNKTIYKRPTRMDKINESSQLIPSAKDLNILNDGFKPFLKGGRKTGLKLLYTFLDFRSEFYSKNMSSPNTASNSCSKLSSYVSFGCISIKEIFQESMKKKNELNNSTSSSKSWVNSIRSFLQRLRWHCHFIQKLEDDCNIENFNLHSSYNLIRNEKINTYFLNSWKTGNTGYPFIDACMRYLITNGWINFRMRAMLISFSSHHLWLHWKAPSIHLARLFTDYEPGIHYSQIQMQSGTTGINKIRIYNPLKQSKDNDPDGIFIKKWVPELKSVPTNHIHEPWSYISSVKYPRPIINEKLARDTALKKIYEIKKNNNFYREARIIRTKHSNSSNITHKKKYSNTLQKSIDFK